MMAFPFTTMRHYLEFDMAPYKNIQAYLAADRGAPRVPQGDGGHLNRRHWLRPRELAMKLAHNEVSNLEVAYFMLGNMILGSVTFYGAFTWANPPWTALSAWEFVLSLVIVAFGMMRCFNAAGGSANSGFAAEFNCLSFPIWLWTNVIVWPTYWAGVWLVGLGFLRLPWDDLQIARNLVQLGGGLSWVWTTFAILGSQILFFTWMRRSLSRMHTAREA